MKRLALGCFAVLAALCLGSSAHADEHRFAIGEAQRVRADIENNARTIAVLLSQARRTSDKRSIACVNETLSEADALTRRARDRILQIQSNLERGDSFGEEKATRLLALLHNDRELARGVANEAYACIGMNAHHVGGPDYVTVRVFIDKDIVPEEAMRRP